MASQSKLLHRAEMLKAKKRDPNGSLSVFKSKVSMNESSGTSAGVAEMVDLPKNLEHLYQHATFKEKDGMCGYCLALSALSITDTFIFSLTNSFKPSQLAISASTHFSSART